MCDRTLTALPVYNEAAHVNAVLDEALRHSQEVLVVDDGSTDGTSELLTARDDVLRIRHRRNRGYGAALRSAFDFAARGGYEVLVTIDCDGQHEPQRIPLFVEACRSADVVSGSRYLKRFSGDSRPPQDRRRVNRLITEELNRRLNLGLTDAFCGFKAYRVAALSRIDLRETGYAMPLELWVRAAELRLRIVELPVPLIYLDPQRSFGGSLDDVETRLAVYREVLDRALAGRQPLPVGAVCGETPA
jgi:dolichol-phosphate mannosyltransferase